MDVNGQKVAIPYPVIVDRRTQQTILAPGPREYPLAPPTVQMPPRFQPPAIEPLILRGKTEEN